MTTAGRSDARVLQSGGGATPLAGRPFVKMTGSGNDFIFFDNRAGTHDDLTAPAIIAALCDRRQGVGADGVVLIDEDSEFAFGMRYFNRDGSLAEMCGNAALCCVRFATDAGIAATPSVAFRTTSGPISGRLVDDVPEVDMNPVTELSPDVALPQVPGERRIGFARVGVPHLVVRCDDVDQVDVEVRGRELRHHASLRDGANVNFTSPLRGQGWAIRTYERGVETETLACGTGTVATVALLNAWGEATGGIALRTRGGCLVYADAGWDRRVPVLRGEGRIVFRGTLLDVLPDAGP